MPEPAIAGTGGRPYAGGSVNAQHIVGRDQTNIGTAAGVDSSELASSYPAPASCGVSAFSTQNSLPSGVTQAE